MALIVRDTNFKKKKIIKKPSFACNTGLYGASKNDFELTLNQDELLSIGDFIVYNTSEFGGAILERITDTKEKTVKYIGKTFRGQMENSIVNPFSVKTLSGTDYEVVNELFNLSQLSYKVLPTGRTAENTVVLPIGTNLLKAVDLALNAFNEKMLIKASNDGVEVTLSPISIDEKKFDASQVDLIVDENQMLPTALHARSKDFSVSVYLQGDGTVSTERYYGGFKAVEISQEITADTLAELTALASDRLLALRKSKNASEVDIKIENSDIGDTINVTIQECGIKVTQTVSEKVLKIEGENEEITFNTGG